MGAYGSLSGGQGSLGMGVVFHLHDMFSANADKIHGKFRELDAVTEEAATRIQSSMNRVKMGLGLMAAGAIPLAAMIFPTIKAMRFQEGMAKINTTAQMTQEQLAGLRMQLMELARTSVVDFERVPDAFEKIISQTNDAGLSMDILKSALKGAKAGFTDIDVVAGALAQTLSIVGKENTNANEVLNTLIAAKRVGAGEFADFANYLPNLIAAGANLRINFQDVAGMFAYMTGKGQSAEHSMTLMQNAFVALGKSDITDGLEKAGVHVWNAAGGFNSIVDIMRNLHDVTGKMSPKEMSLFFEKIGLHDMREKNAFSVLSGDVGKLKEALDATRGSAGELDAAVRNSYNPEQEYKQAMNEISYTVTKLGVALMPMATGALKILSAAFHAAGTVMRILTDNPIGRWVLYLTAGVALLTFGVGAYITVANLAHWASAKAAVTFAMMGKAAVADAFATGGLTAGMTALAASVWAALVPMLPFIAAGVALVGIVILGVKALHSFRENMDGIADGSKKFGWLEKLGGVIAGVIDIFQSWNGATFQLSKTMHDSLQRMGMLEMVLSLGTWAVRVKEFLSGLWQGFKSIFQPIGALVRGVWHMIEPVFKGIGFVIDATNRHIFHGTGHIRAWVVAGKLLGGLIAITLIPTLWGLVSAVFALAGGIIMATLPLIVLVGAIIGIIAVVQNWGAITDWIARKWGQAMNWISNKIGQFIDWFNGIPSRIGAAGARWVDALRNGIASKWEGFKTWLLAKMDWLKNLNPMNWFGGHSGNAAGNISPVHTGRDRIMPVMTQNNTASRTTSTTTHVIDKGTHTVDQITVPVSIDGKVLHRVVIDKEKLEKSRQ